MDTFDEYLISIENPAHSLRMREVLSWVIREFPNLKPRIAWNQPMFTDHGTFFIGFSVSKHHLSVAPERVVIIHFSDEIIKSGYEHTKELIHIPWDSPVDSSLLERIIKFNIIEKSDCLTFWRK